jgi:hypothetical protein
MEKQFWILAGVALIGCLIFLAIDYSNSQKDEKSKEKLLWGYGIAFAVSLVALWGITAIPTVVINGAAIMAFIFFSRYLIRKAAGRKQ